MARIVCIHGIDNEVESRETLLSTWVPALCGGVSTAGGRLDPDEIDIAFYGVLFRKGTKHALQAIPRYAPGDLSEIEKALLDELAESATMMDDDGVPSRKLGERTTASILQVLAQTPFFGNVAQHVVIWYLKQVSGYVSDPRINQAARQALLKTIGPDTRVIVAHSLGSVVAYEVLCAATDLGVRSFITLGSPLGLSALGPRIKPPISKAGAQWPTGITRWWNFADAADLVAVTKRLAPIFGTQVVDQVVHNGATMHDSKPYLTSPQLGQAIMAALSP